MTVSRRTEVILGLAVPIVVLAALLVLGLNADASSTWIAFMAAVPMFAAMFTRALFTGIVALAAFLAAMMTAAATYGQDFADAIPVVVGVIIGAGAAVMASQMKSAAATPRWEPARPAQAAASSGVSASEPDIDGLTGLPTRSAARRELDTSATTGRRVVAVIGCDGMSALNDERGSAIGDVFLFAVAGRTRWALPDGDTVARWGGDEILVVIDGDLAATEPTLHLITDKVNKNPIRTDEGLIPLTISLGAAEWVDGSTFDEALARARSALHRAKGSGGGRLVVDAISAR